MNGKGIACCIHEASVADVAKSARHFGRRKVLAAHSALLALPHWPHQCQSVAAPIPPAQAVCEMPWVLTEALHPATRAHMSCKADLEFAHSAAPEEAESLQL